MNIVIFFTDFPINICQHVTDLIDDLSKKGFSIDLFLYKCGNIIPKFNKNVNVIILPHDKNLNIPLLTKIKNFARIHSSFEKNYFISNEAEDILINYFKNNYYDYCIAIEKRSLVFLKSILKIKDIPFAYQSLELYNPSAPGIWTNKEIDYLISLENSMLKKSSLFIIQDKIREKVFFKDRKIKNYPKIFYLPVSISRRKIKKTNYWHKKYDLTQNRKIVLSIGQIDSDRMVCEVVKVVQKFPDNYNVILHGPVGIQTIKELNSLDIKAKVKISNKLVNNDKLFEFSAASDVGLVLYKSVNANQTTAARSSHKMAIHAMTSIPVICLNHRSFKEIVNRYHCGVCIDNIGEIRKALNEVFLNYDFFKKGSMRAYDDVYCLDNYIPNLIKIINNTVVNV